LGAGEPLEGDGTLSLSHWSAESASVSANQLDIGVSIGRGGAGRVDLRGPATLRSLRRWSVRDNGRQSRHRHSMDAGWRIVPNSGCLAVSLAALMQPVSPSRADIWLCVRRAERLSRPTRKQSRRRLSAFKGWRSAAHGGS